MDLRLLRCFVAVYEEKSITAAAGSLFHSQPAISSAIKSLEETLGTTLFLRHKKGVNLTDEAHYLYPLALRLLSDVDRLPGLFQQRKQQRPFKLATYPGLSQLSLARVLATLQDENPELLLELVDSAGTPDASITLDCQKGEDQIFLPLWEEDYVLCMRPEHPLA